MDEAPSKHGKPIDHHAVLNDALHALSSLHGLNMPMRVRDDYIIETSIGAFRTAYSPSTHCMALFYARHPHDLMGGDVREDGFLEIAHKSHPYLVKMYKVFHSKDARWSDDPRQQFDLSWLRREVPRVIHDLPRILNREANLHRTGESTYTSAFVGYQTELEDNGEYSACASTKTRHNHQLTSVVASVDTKPKNAKQRLFRWVGRAITNRHLGQSSPVSRIRLNEDGTNTIERTFKERSLDDALSADFSTRLQQMWEGELPIKMGEMPLLPFMHAGEALKERAIRLQEMVMNDRSDFIRELGAFGVHVAIDGPLSAVESLLIDKAAVIGAQQRSNSTPHEWQELLRAHSWNMISLDSALHRTIYQMDEGKFGDLGFLNPEKHACSYSPVPDDLQKPDADCTFQNWFGSLLLAPYGNLFEYLDKNGKHIHPQNTADVKLVQAHTSNGMVLNYLPRTQTLYGYYHRPKYISPNRKLPYDAANYLNAGEVLVLPLKGGPHTMSRISFTDFTGIMRDAMGDCGLTLDTAQKPELDAINPMPDAMRNDPAALLSITRENSL